MEKPEISAAETHGAADPAVAPKQWYVLKVQSNREKSIRDNIVRRIKMEGMQDYFGEIFIPTEKVVETKGSVRRVREQKTLPGYMMIEMLLTDESWHLVRSTSGVGDFTGAAGKPIPMGEAEVRRWRGLEVPADVKEEKESRPVVRFAVERGDHVKVKDGPFLGFEGTVDALDETTGKVKVIMEIIGRSTEVELDHWQVEKL
jgi:transcriptional antiterminator NusG